MWQHDLFKVWEITDDILEVVQDRYTVAMKLYVAYLNGTITGDLE